MGWECLVMTKREVDRLEVIQQVLGKVISQVEAAARLGLCMRQVRRLLRRYRAEGAAGLVSRRRGKRANNAIDGAIQQTAISLIREKYPDFGPTFAHEKLAEQHGFSFSVETLRKWMIEADIWRARGRRNARIHQRRPRRPCFGELIQADGSPHDWFEDRGPRCTLIVFIDDASSELTQLRFAPAETTQAYMQTLDSHLETYGRPGAIYSDKHSIFRINRSDCEDRLTQFSRALKTLDIEPIHANTPQAKGRVERANLTLQDRLVKELRLRNISDIESANAFLPEFLVDYNKRFGVAPASEHDAHRLVLHSARDLSLILSLHHTRKLSKNLTLQFKNREYQIQGEGNGYRMRKSTVTICEAFDGEVTILHNGRELDWRLLAEGEPPIPVTDEKGLHHTVDQAIACQGRNPARKPRPDHPWKKRALVDHGERV